MPRTGDVRGDGYVWDANVWRSPEGFAKACAYRKEYKRQFNLRTATRKGATRSNAGESAEFLVAHDLLYRGLEVTKSLNRNCPDDIHVKVGGKWHTVQVKVAAVNTKTDNIELTGGQFSRITSDLIAAVDLAGKRIRWVSNTDEPVPEELL